MKRDWMIKESELDDDQIQVLMATLNKSCVVSGCAGSGKSVLALIKAQRVQNEFGNNYKIIVFTKALCKYMNAGRIELGLKNQFYYHWDWKNRLKCEPSDYMIVDEIQDFSKEEIIEFLRATKKNFFFFGDSAQSIYEGLKNNIIPVNEIANLLSSSSKPKNFDLYRNYRLPLPVARVADYIDVEDEPFLEMKYKSSETAIPRIIKYKNKKEQIDEINNIIKNRNLTDVAILLQHNEEALQVFNYLRTLGGNYELKYNNKEDYRNNIDSLNFNSTNPKIMTYHSAKGLQFETVFLPYIEDFTQERISDQKALYVAMTRTYRYLYILYSDRLPSPLSNIDKSLYETSAITEINDI